MMLNLKKSLTNFHSYNANCRNSLHVPMHLFWGHIQPLTFFDLVLGLVCSRLERVI